jgi:cob(I)alamin adenosyltransferase
MKIYTRSGDTGETGLFGGQRVAKSHPRVEAYGALDELNAVIGLAVANIDDSDLRARLTGVQSRLFDIGADLATPAGSRAGDWLPRAQPEWVAAVEADIDAMEAELTPLATFILPGGSPGAAWLHLARTVCRRAERRTIQAAEADPTISPVIVAYLNRLGDWLFVAARLANARAGVSEQPWQPDRDRGEA